MSERLLKRDDQQPSLFTKGYRYVRYNAEDVLIGCIVIAEALSFYCNVIPIKIVMYGAIVLTAILLAIGVV